jgi:glutamate-1-semialdehyde 2,1-aminomutase
MNVKQSSALFERAQQVMPGGVNSPVRACKAVDAAPLFVSHGDGCHLWSVDGDRYIDMVGSWGPLILGHAHSEVLDAIQETMSDGTTFGAPTELEVRLAEEICHAVPSMERVRAVSSGTEATMSAPRLARAVTGRQKVVKAAGGYHGHADFLLAEAGSGAATFGIPGSAGVPEAAARDTLVVPYNDLAAARAAFESASSEIAAFIVEPVAGNMGVVPPDEGYLAGLRALTKEHGALLLFDEVITGFRVAYGGAQSLFDLAPDLTCLGKIVGGGLPAAAFGGRADLMARLAPAGDVYQAGTLSGNPLAMAAGLKTLEILRRPSTYERLDELGARLETGLARAIRETRVEACTNRVGSMLTLFFTRGPVKDYAQARASNLQMYGTFFRAMRERGIYLPPSQFEAWFVSLAHSENEIDEIVEKAAESLGTL